MHNHGIIRGVRLPTKQSALLAWAGPRTVSLFLVAGVFITRMKGLFALNADVTGAQSEELEGSTSSLLRALSGMGGTLYRYVCFRR